MCVCECDTVHMCACACRYVYLPRCACACVYLCGCLCVCMEYMCMSVWSQAGAGTYGSRAATMDQLRFSALFSNELSLEAAEILQYSSAFNFHANQWGEWPSPPPFSSFSLPSFCTFLHSLFLPSFFPSFSLTALLFLFPFFLHQALGLV